MVKEQTQTLLTICWILATFGAMSLLQKSPALPAEFVESLAGRAHTSLHFLAQVNIWSNRFQVCNIT